LIERTLQLAGRALAEEPHLYLRFYGD
jgi:hypothetical protein